MEDVSKSMTPQDSLKLIEKFIANYRRNYQSDSYFFLLWGWLIALASLSHFILLRVMIGLGSYTHINLFSALIWGGFVVTGFLMQYFHMRRNQDKSLIRSHLDRVISVLWQTTGYGILLVALLSIKLGEYPSPFVLTVAGLATFITGRVIRFSPLKWGGIVFFIFAVVAAFVVNEYQLLVNAVAIVLGYIIPGYLLRKSK
jgi:hypothetical protein